MICTHSWMGCSSPFCQPAPEHLAGDSPTNFLDIAAEGPCTAARAKDYTFQVTSWTGFVNTNWVRKLVRTQFVNFSIWHVLRQGRAPLA